MRIVLTGAFGYLGGRVGAALAAGGHEVVFTGRVVPPWGAGLALDVLDPDAAARALAGAGAVVQLAALDEHEAARDPERALAVSRDGTRVMLEAAERAGARLLFVSTFHVLGDQAQRGALLDEECVPAPRHPYALAHLAGEALCRGRATVLRLSNAYGAPVHRAVERWTLAHNDFCRQAVEHGRIVLATSGEQQRDLVWVDDLARAIDCALDAPIGLYHVGSGSSRSIRALAELVRVEAERRLGRPIALEHPPHTGEPPPPVRFSVERLRARGFAPSDRLRDETGRLFTLLGA